ncbi:MAG: hypothetical protein IJZ53_10780 [Tyzzerella sp.]|nr:hypothetical protein [Tyzzerella sp.]
MNKKERMIPIICSMVLIVTTIIFYILTFKNIFTVTMQWLSLMMLLVAEVIGAIKIIASKDSIFKVANVIASGVHIIIVFVCSIIFVNFMPLLLKTYILLNVLGLAGLTITDILIIFFQRKVKESDQELKEKQEILRKCLAKTQSLSVKCQSIKCVEELKKLAEMLKYSDNSVSTGDELTIMTMLNQLDIISDEEEMIRKIAEIKNIVEIRTISGKELQRGKF